MTCTCQFRLSAAECHLASQQASPTREVTAALLPQQGQSAARLPDRRGQGPPRPGSPRGCGRRRGRVRPRAQAPATPGVRASPPAVSLRSLASTRQPRRAGTAVGRRLGCVPPSPVTNAGAPPLSPGHVRGQHCFTRPCPVEQDKGGGAGATCSRSGPRLGGGTASLRSLGFLPRGWWEGRRNPQRPEMACPAKAWSRRPTVDRVFKQRTQQGWPEWLYGKRV